MVHCHVHNSLPQIIFWHKLKYCLLILYLFNIYFNIIFSTTPISCTRFHISLWKLSMCVSSLPFVLHAHPFHFIQLLSLRIFDQHSRSRWPPGLRRRSAAERFLGSWVRIPPGAWMFVLYSVCVVRYRSLLRTDPSSRGVLPTVVCVWVWSNEKSQKPTMPTLNK
jgi:hypothetical protein